MSLQPFPSEMPLGARAAGVLLHPTSLPGPWGIGSLGAAARGFVDWLETARVRLWQMLPLVPADASGSPYSSWSALAGHPYLVDVDELVHWGLLAPLAPAELPPEPADDGVDVDAARRLKMPRIAQAAQTLLARPASALFAEYEAFCHSHRWVRDVATFSVLRDTQGGAPWWRWPTLLAAHDAAAVARWQAEHADAVERACVVQFFFQRQLVALRHYAAVRGVALVGDVPIYVARDSADVWAHRELFRLHPDSEPTVVAGAPPDAFSATGQLWGNPLYDWQKLADTGYAWWIERLQRAFELADVVRIDHFRGFSAFWEVPATAVDARPGRWVQGPGAALFRAIERGLQHRRPLPIIAEDLGVIDEPVRRLLARLGYPGMRVLQFGFDGDALNPHLPQNYPENAVAYTGTHDHAPLVAWWQAIDAAERQRVRQALAFEGDAVVWPAIAAVLGSAARSAVLPMQDLLELGAEARMNTPATLDGNWRWRMPAAALGAKLAAKLRHIIEATDRAPPV